MKPGKLRLVLAGILLWIGGALLLTALLPLTTVRAVIPIQASLSTEWGGPRQVVVQWPKKLRLGETGMINLTLTFAAQTNAQTAAGPEMRRLVAARVDLLGLNLERGESFQPLLPNSSNSFRWKIRADAPGVYQGMLWLHLQRLADGDTPGSPPVDEVLLLARPLEIHCVTVWGLSQAEAQILGGAVMGGGVLIAYTLWRGIHKHTQPSRGIGRL